MEEILHSMYVQSLRAKLELCRITAASLMESLDSPKLTVEERQTGYQRWTDVTRDGDVLEFMLELLRRRGRETKQWML